MESRDLVEWVNDRNEATVTSVLSEVEVPRALRRSGPVYLDHVGSAAEVRAWSGAEVAAHAALFGHGEPVGRAALAAAVPGPFAPAPR